MPINSFEDGVANILQYQQARDLWLCPHLSYASVVAESPNKGMRVEILKTAASDLCCLPTRW